MMSNASKRSILRSIHIIFSIPILGYIYSPFEQLPSYAPIVRYVALPLIVLSGFWMWISSAPSKSILVPLGVVLILLGIVAPLPVAPAAQSMPPGTLRSLSFLAVNLFRICFFVGVACAIVGARRNRKLKQRNQDGIVA
jgi:predicted tellurium resistance membrane protein TerC